MQKWVKPLPVTDGMEEKGNEDFRTGDHDEDGGIRATFLTYDDHERYDDDRRSCDAHPPKKGRSSRFASI